MIEDFLTAGGTGIDTANGYAGGRSETMLGELLNDHRDQVVLATKVGIPHPDADDAAPLSVDGIRRCVAGSLHRLGTDHVDLLYLHQPDRSTPIAHTLDALQDLLTAGLIRAWGASNYAAWQIAELRYTAADLGVPDPVIAQQVYNIVATRLDDEYAEYAHTTGLPTVVYNPLAGGLLTGKHTPEESPGTGRFGATRIGTMYRDRYWNDTAFTAVQALQTLAQDAGVPAAKLALRWAIGRPVVNAVLIGGSRPENIRTNLHRHRQRPTAHRTLASRHRDLDHGPRPHATLQPLTDPHQGVPQRIPSGRCRQVKDAQSHRLISVAVTTQLVVTVRVSSTEAKVSVCPVSLFWSAVGSGDRGRRGRCTTRWRAPPFRPVTGGGRERPPAMIAGGRWGTVPDQCASRRMVARGDGNVVEPGASGQAPSTGATRRRPGIFR
jgi:aryl-alcohol dehydrogenase-like predicted oxidoreductase